MDLSISNGLPDRVLPLLHTSRKIVFSCYKPITYIYHSVREFACLSRNKLLQTLVFAAVILVSEEVTADLTAVPGLTPPQAAAASALQRIFQQFENEDESTVPDIFFEARELVHTSNEQQGTGPTEFSLNIDEEALRDALQWNANEEINNPGTVVTKTMRTHQINLIGRIAALRGGATGFSVSGLQFHTIDGDYASASDSYLDDYQYGGSAGTKDSPGRKWGGFLNGSIGVGDKDATPIEDAFEFVNYGITGGVDYRVNNQFVLGGALGFSIVNSDFDSQASVVDGKVDTEGVSLAGYALYQVGDFYLDGIVSLGVIDYEMTRSIQYASNNPLIDSTDETAISDTDSSQYAIGLSAGYDKNVGATTFSPYAKVNYLDINIDGFREDKADAFNLEVSDQDIQSLVTIVGGMVTYSVSSSYGVFLPQLRAEWHHEFENDKRNIRSRYIGVIESGSDIGFFDVPTESPDRDYAVLGIGLSGVFKNNLQTFFQYDGLFGYQDINSHLFTLGLRMEF